MSLLFVRMFLFFEEDNVFGSLENVCDYLKSSNSLIFYDGEVF